MYVEEIRRRAEDAPRAALPSVMSAMWAAFAEGKITEEEAGTLSRVIAEKQQAPDPTPTARLGDPAPLAGAGIVKRYGSAPRTDASMARRRTWAASGRLPPQLAARFTLAEVAVLAVVAAESSKRGDCRLAVGHLAAVAGVSSSTVRNALREAHRLGLLTIELRRLTGFRNDTNVVRIISAEWTAWGRLARRETRALGEGGGCKSVMGTPTGVLSLGKTAPLNRPKSYRGPAVDPLRCDRSGIAATRSAAQPMH
ncbi:hypothetical protein QO012_004546 [Methylobacterium aerolatum]|uniref:Helix-turn-helix domain-containing protein n=1 Tax=Methylobacterium aerolatum TaxID=418708 RepID=A0ABU0I5X4_9HYPH|nr:hypothetical protein [Methylobacterium aerolatum]